MSPFTRVPFGAPIFDPQPCGPPPAVLGDVAPLQRVGRLRS